MGTINLLGLGANKYFVEQNQFLPGEFRLVMGGGGRLAKITYWTQNIQPLKFSIPPILCCPIPKIPLIPQSSNHPIPKSPNPKTTNETIPNYPIPKPPGWEGVPDLPEQD